MCYVDVEAGFKYFYAWISYIIRFHANPLFLSFLQCVGFDI